VGYYPAMTEFYCWALLRVYAIALG
jgi:hypothetical protein